MRPAVLNGEGAPDLTITTHVDGTFEIASLKPGHYQLTARKTGFASSVPVGVDLAPGQTVNETITLGVAVPPGGIFQRLFRAYAEDWKGTAAGAPTPLSRLPASRVGQPLYIQHGLIELWPVGASGDDRFARVPRSHQEDDSVLIGRSPQKELLRDDDSVLVPQEKVRLAFLVPLVSIVIGYVPFIPPN